VKIITVPQEITVKLGTEEKGFPFKTTLISHLDSYGELKTVSQVRDAAKIIDAIEAGNGTIALEDAQFDILAAACKKAVYHPAITRQLLSYYDAMDTAQDVKK
jgi:hypothetical protein